MTLSKLSKFLNLTFESLETEASYSQSQSLIQNKLFYPLKIIFFAVLLVPIAFSIIQGNPLQELFWKSLPLLMVLFAGLLSVQWQKLHNPVFILVFWFGCFQLPKTILDFYAKDDRIPLFFVGYIIGILEVIIAFSIKQFYYRVALQMTLIVSKILRFSEFLDDELILIISLCFVGFLSVFFFSYNSNLERSNFKTINDLQIKLKNFHAFHADDFPISVITLDHNLENVLYSNQCFRETFNFQDENISPAMLKLSFRKFVIEPDTLPTESRPINLLNFIQTQPKEKLSKKEPLNVYVLYRADHETQYRYEVKIHEIMWGKEPAFAIILNNISEKQQLIALKLASEQKDRMLATISHELKTPINGIIGLLDIVKSQIKDEALLTYLNHCHGCSKLLLYFVNSLLDLNLLKQETFQVEKDFFNLDDLLKEIKSLFTFTALQKSVELYFEKDDRVPQYIYTDKRRLTEILIQIMGNAVKFTFKGSVKLKVSLAKLSRTDIIFSVEDTGVGIKEEDKAGLFSTFGGLSQPKRNINLHGVGLGLNIANSLVKTLNDNKEGQHLFMETEANKGSRFWFAIKAKPDRLESSPDLTDPEIFEENTRYETTGTVLGTLADAVTRNILDSRADCKVTSLGSQMNTDCASIQPIRKNILIVDDNPFNLLAASHMVKKVGFTPFTANSGEECLDMLKKSRFSEHKFNLILMDIQMPLMDGIETTRLINQEIKSGKLYPVPIAALTAKMINSEERRKYKDLGMCEALEKPLVESHLKNVLRNFLV